MLLAHLSDLHLRGEGDVARLDRQLERIAARQTDHLAVTGDLLDRWNPRLFELALDAFAARGFMNAQRLTLLYGNHDLASSGGHPRRGSDLWRLALRFWDPPPLVARRRRLFLAAAARRAAGIISTTPSLKTLPSGVRIAALNTVPTPWRPLRLVGRVVLLQHAVGAVSTHETQWLGALAGTTPLIVLLHHYPLETPEFSWAPTRHDFEAGGAAGVLARLVREVRVPMAIETEDRDRFWKAAVNAGVKAVLCGHVHRTRLDWQGTIAVGLNGQSGADWAGRTIAFYEFTATGDGSIRMQTEPG